MIKTNMIKDEELTLLLENLENALTFLRKPPYFIDKLPDYSYYLSRLLKSIENNLLTHYSELIERIKFNSSFESELLKHGNTLDNIPKELNPKEILIQTVQLISNRNNKAETVFKMISDSVSIQNKILIICNNHDESFLQEYILKTFINNSEVVRYKKFIKMKEEELENNLIIGYFLEGYRDFEIFHNLTVIINLFLYDFENELYKDCLNKYKLKLEAELSSEDRLLISGIKYEPPPSIPMTISQSLQSIIDRTKNWTEKEFDNNIDDPDESSNEHILYTIEYENNYENDFLNSTDAVFDEHNNLIRVNNLKTGNLIRVYKQVFGEILLNTAMEFQQEEFLEIEKNSQLWKNVLTDLYVNKYNCDINHLHLALKRFGLRVLPSTVLNNWINGKTKFPQREKALKAIYELSKDIRLGASMGMILTSKRIYNGTLISLGRDLKDELKIFLLEGTIGEIINQNNITSDTLHQTIEQQMPLQKIKKINSTVIKAEDLNE